MEQIEPTNGAVGLPPIKLTQEQEELCVRLDELHAQYGLAAKPSTMFRGALFAARIECRNNTDWIAQAANSLREILYPFWSPQVKAVTDKKVSALKSYGAVLADESFMQGLGRVYGQLNDLAHHGATATKLDFLKFGSEEFENLLADFEDVMRDALTRQIDLHSALDQILASGPPRLNQENEVIDE